MIAIAKSEPILQIPPSQLVEREGFNVRLADDPGNIEHIEALAASIAEVGVKQPLSAYKDIGPPSQTEVQYVVTDGHCRLAAVQLCIARGVPIASVPVRLEPKRANEADYTFGMIVRNQSRPLSALELGIVMKRLLDLGWTAQDLARKSGYSLTHVHNCVALAQGPVEVQKMVETGEVSATLASEVVQASGSGEAATETLREAVAIATEENAAKWPSKQAKKPKATKKHVVAAARKLPPKPSGKKPTKQPEPSSMMSDEKLVTTLRDMSVANALSTFDGFGKRRQDVFAILLDRANPVPSRSLGRNGHDPRLDTLKTTLGRAIADDPTEDGIITVVMTTDEWQTTVDLLGLGK